MQHEMSLSTGLRSTSKQLIGLFFFALFMVTLIAWRDASSWDQYFLDTLNVLLCAQPGLFLLLYAKSHLVLSEEEKNGLAYKVARVFYWLTILALFGLFAWAFSVRFAEKIAFYEEALSVWLFFLLFVLGKVPVQGASLVRIIVLSLLAGLVLHAVVFFFKRNVNVFGFCRFSLSLPSLPETQSYVDETLDERRTSLGYFYRYTFYE